LLSGMPPPFAGHLDRIDSERLLRVS